MSVIVRNFIRFCVIVIFQVLILNKITLRWWSSPSGFPVFIPYIYPLVILLLPFEISVTALLIIGFILGLTVDSFMNTAGMHAFACVLIAYLRTNVLNALLPRSLAEYGSQTPSVKNMGWGPFLVYSGFLLFIHHFVFFAIEQWSFVNIGYLLLKILASTITSVLFVVAYLLLFTKQNTARA